MSTNCEKVSTKSFTVNCLDRHGIHLKKKFGQNFLIDSNIVNRIIDLSGVMPDDKVIEVGPGIGSLTCALLNVGANVASVEADVTLVPALLENVEARSAQFKLILKDALKIDSRDLPFCPNKFIANLPYSVASRLIIDFFKKFESLESACVMVQKEVADRICAKPGNKDYGAYSVKIQSIADVEDRFDVSRNSFLPPPRVDSSVIRLVKKDNLPAEIDDIFKTANALFCNRRKTIYNCAISSFGKDNATNIRSWFESCNIDPSLRAEVLSIKDFHNLASKLYIFMR